MELNTLINLELQDNQVNQVYLGLQAHLYLFSTFYILTSCRNHCRLVDMTVLSKNFPDMFCVTDKTTRSGMRKLWFQFQRTKNKIKLMGPGLSWTVVPQWPSIDLIRKGGGRNNELAGKLYSVLLLSSFGLLINNCPVMVMSLLWRAETYYEICTVSLLSLPSLQIVVRGKGVEADYEVIIVDNSSEKLP